MTEKSSLTFQQRWRQNWVITFSFQQKGKAGKINITIMKLKLENTHM